MKHLNIYKIFKWLIVGLVGIAVVFPPLLSAQDKRDLPIAFVILDTKDSREANEGAEVIKNMGGDFGVGDLNANVLFARMPKELAPSLIF